MNANNNNDHQGAKAGESPLSDQVSEASAMAHRSMRRYFESIDCAVREDRFDDGVQLLNGLISAAREHFTNEESIARSGGKPRSAGGKLLHEAFVHRARLLQARCKNSETARLRSGDIRNALVLLLSDMVESDLRIQKRIDDSPNTPLSEPFDPGSL